MPVKAANTANTANKAANNPSPKSDGLQWSKPRFEFSPGVKTAIRLMIGFITIVMGFLLVLNIQPWVEVAAAGAKEVRVIPFQDTIVSIPYLGGLILWCIVNGAVILAIGLWGIVNGFENLPFLLDTAIGKKVPREILDNLLMLRLIAYCIDVTVCWVRYPTYQGGWNAVVQDFPNFDMNLIDWQGTGVFLLSVLGAEAVVFLLTRLWAIDKKLKSAA